MPRPRDYPPTGLLVFVVGAASLGAEIAAARLLAPYFGASTFIWANTIATVLVALAIGYALGGRLADRDPRRERLCQIVLAAACLLALVPFISGPILRLAVDALSSISLGAFVGSLLAVLVLVAVPVLLLGAVAPFAIRLSLERTEDAGSVSGRLYAISPGRWSVSSSPRSCWFRSRARIARSSRSRCRWRQSRRWGCRDGSLPSPY